VTSESEGPRFSRPAPEPTGPKTTVGSSGSYDSRFTIHDSQLLPLFAPAAPDRPIAYRHGRPVLLAEFRQDVAAIIERLPRGAFMIDLCEDRYRFLAAYAAAAHVRHTVLLPPSRVEQIVAEVEASYADSYRIDDAMVDAAISDPSPESRVPSPDKVSASVPANHTIMIGFTSGSTGEPQRFPKLWGGVAAGAARNMAAIRNALGCDDSMPLSVLATVPPQHMYGMEWSVLLALIGGVAVHSGRPLFPADIAQALDELEPPRVLVATPVHLRAIVQSAQRLPPVQLVISATAPLDQPLAAAVERKLDGRLLEVFGSTETGAFASRRTADEATWRAYDGVALTPQPDGTVVNAPWFTGPVVLQDIVELQDEGRFVVRGRNTDMIEVAGKRGSLGDLTRRLLAIEGVQDAVVFQPDADSAATIRRVAALVVAPRLTSAKILEQLASGVDPAFLPRPLVIVDSLPRNEVGKLPREKLLQALRRK
jgi:acyl-coenzyme A synthetase/AMP-(fatty) acid ligase